VKLCPNPKGDHDTFQKIIFTNYGFLTQWISSQLHTGYKTGKGKMELSPENCYQVYQARCTFTEIDTFAELSVSSNELLLKVDKFSE
jgi:hypothetical protein